MMGAKIGSAAMQLYIIRHAQSTNNVLTDQRYRVCDPALTELGLRQAEVLARHLADGTDQPPVVGQPDERRGYGITRLYCSPMRRALQTAAPVARALGLRPEVWIDIHEYGGVWVDHGDGRGPVGYPGVTRGELAQDFPGFLIPDELTETGWWRGAQEEAEAFVSRAAQVAATLFSWSERQERVAIITHAAFADGLLCALFEVGRAQPVHYHHDNTGISLLDFRPQGGLSIRYLNRLDHLRADMASG